MKFLRTFVFVVAFPFCGFAQLHSSETWFGFETSLDLLENVGFDFESDIKFSNQFFMLKSHSQELGLGYAISKSVKIGAAYKLSHKYYEQGFFAGHTTSANIRVRTKYKFFRFDYRNKCEMSRNSYINDESDLLFKFENRNRLKVSYKRKKFWWEPSLTVETFHPLVNASYGLSEIRYSVGVSVELIKDLAFDVGYTHKQIVNSRVPESVSVITIAIAKNF